MEVKKEISSKESVTEWKQFIAAPEKKVLGVTLKKPL